MVERLAALVQRDKPADSAESQIRVCVLAFGSGLGDEIVLARFLRDLRTACGDIVFDVMTYRPERSRWIMESVPGVDRVLSSFRFAATRHRYPLAISVGQVPMIHDDLVNLRAITRNSRLTQVVQKIRDFSNSEATAIAQLPYSIRSFGRLATRQRNGRRAFLHHICGIGYGGDRLSLRVDISARRRFGLEGTTYVTLHNGFDPEFVISAHRATKCYPHFAGVLQEIRRHLPDLVVVQLGAETSEPIPGVDVQLVRKTSLGQAAGLLAGASLHIDIDSGLVHLAAALGVASCVVFGPTDHEYLAYPRNENLAPPFCGNCWWSNESWMDQCPKGYGKARCMDEQPPKRVAESVLRRLKGETKGHPSP